MSSDNNITTDSHKEGITLFKILRITAVDNMDFDHITIVAYCKCTVLRPVYTGDFCGHFSHSDACDWVVKYIYIALHRWSSTFVSQSI